MQDRVSANPGRVLITPESGEPYYAVISRADNPSVEGTKLNKANLLSDTTASLFGLGANAVPNDVFSYVGEKLDDLLQDVEIKSSIIVGTYTGNNASSRLISLNKKIKGVLVMPNNGFATIDIYSGESCAFGGLSLEGSPPKIGTNSTITVQGNGFYVYYKQVYGANVYTNLNGVTYNYIAFY